MAHTIISSLESRIGKALPVKSVASLSIVVLLTPLLTAMAIAAPTPTPKATAALPTYAGLLLHHEITTPITIPAGTTVHGIDQLQGTNPLASEYGVSARAIIYVQGGDNDTTCLVKLAGGAVWGTPITVPAHTTVTIPFEDTSPGFPGQHVNIGMAIQAGSGGPLTVLPGSIFTIETVASQPGNNAY